MKNYLNKRNRLFFVFNIWVFAFLFNTLSSMTKTMAINVDCEKVLKIFRYGNEEDIGNLYKILFPGEKLLKNINHKFGEKLETGLMIAVRFGNFKAFKFLLDKKADVTLTNNNGKTVFNYAVDYFPQEKILEKDEYKTKKENFINIIDYLLGKETELEKELNDRLLELLNK